MTMHSLFGLGVNPYEEPWMVDSKTRDDHGVSDLLIDHLKALNDPRLPVYANPAADGQYRGFVLVQHSKVTYQLFPE
jgi:hypothetical protein